MWGLQWRRVKPQHIDRLSVEEHSFDWAQDRKELRGGLQGWMLVGT